MTVRGFVGPVLALLTVVACTGGDGDAARPTGPSPTPTRTLTESSTPITTPSPTPEPVVIDPAAMRAVVDHLAGGIGPREAASPAFHEAADYVAGQFTSFGYQVSRIPVAVPAGVSWGVAVDAGTSANVIADPPGFDPARPHVIVGAHLDTVPQAPGAEDNASGVAVMLDLARMAAAQPPGLPVRFVAFGAEEPRGEGDDLHHFGSRQYVQRMPAAERTALVGMVSLDRVGVHDDQVPVCTGGRGTTSVRDAVVVAAGTVGVSVGTCENRASDHWSFEKAGLPSVRLGSVPYPAYHSPDDVPAVVDDNQLAGVGTVTWAWLTSL